MSRHEKTAAFHVGAHKTGTSVFQQYLEDNSRTLLRRRLLHVSRSDMNEYVGWGAKLVRDPAPLADRLRQLRRNPWYRALIASHENTIGRPFTQRGACLYAQAPASIAVLSRVIEPCRPRIFLSIRPQDELVESYYLQTVHQGSHQAFADWFARVDPDAISWQPLVDLLVRTFGRDNVDIIDFALLKQGQEAYIRHFLTAVDPGLAFDIRYTRNRNRSVSEKGLRMALAANPHMKTGDERKLLRKFLQRHFSNLHYPRPALLSEEQRRAIQARYGEEYQRLIGAATPTPAGAVPTGRRLVP